MKKASKTFATPEEYIGDIADEARRHDVESLHAFIRKAVPKLKPHMMSGMIAYGAIHYRNKSGKGVDWSIVMLANNKNYISVYVFAISDEGQYLAEKYKAALPKASIGKSCIGFKKTDDIDLGALKKLILEGVAMMRKFEKVETRPA